MSRAALESAARSGCALGLYRGLLNLALLVVVFREFPEHRLPIALAVLVFSQGVAAIGTGQKVFFNQQNLLDDLAERKTRHAILLASEENRSDYYFWSEVDRRVADEAGPPDKPAPWWTQGGLILLGIAGYLLGDLLAILIAFAFT